MFVCSELIEETGRPPGLIFGMWGYFWPGSDKFESWKKIHTFDHILNSTIRMRNKAYPHANIGVTLSTFLMFILQNRHVYFVKSTFDKIDITYIYI